MSLWSEWSADAAVSVVGRWSQWSADAAVSIAAADGYTLSASSGALAAVGAAASLRADRRLAAAGGTAATAGGTASLRTDRHLAADSTSIALSGSQVTLRKTGALELAASGGEISLAGAPVTFSIGRALTLSAAGGSVDLAGAPASLRIVWHRMAAEGGDVSLAGGSASFFHTEVLVLVAATGAYAADHADAYRSILEAGALVRFVSQRPGSYNPETDTFTAPTPSSLPGAALAVKGDPERYAALGLTKQGGITLLFASEVYGGTPEPGDAVTWGGATYTVRDCEPVAPDGSAILASVVCAR